MESNVNREIRNYHEGVVMGLSVAADGLRSACRRSGRSRELRLTAVSWNRTCECRMYSGGGNSGSNRLCVLSWSAL